MCVTSKSIVVILSVLFGFCPALAQEGSNHTNKDSLYAVALFASLREMQKSWGYIDDNDSNTLRMDYRHMFVESDPRITDGLPSEDGEYRVEYLDMQAQKDRCQKLKKHFAILTIEPMRSDGSVLEIQVSVSHLSYMRHRLTYGFSDWSDVHFRYDCKSQRFVVSTVELGGI